MNSGNTQGNGEIKRWLCKQYVYHHCRAVYIQFIAPKLSSRVWVRFPVMTLVPLSEALNHNCLVKSWKGCSICSSNQAPIVEYPCLHNICTLITTCTFCEGGNPVSAPGVGWQRVPGDRLFGSITQIRFNHSPHLEVAICPCGAISH